VRRIFTTTGIFALLLDLAACAPGDAAGPSPDLQFRCAGGGVGLVGLVSVSVSGKPSVSGVFGSVFANDKVTLAGNFEIEGDVVSGGKIEISGKRRPGGQLIENSFFVDAPVVDAVVAAARKVNDNDEVPCADGWGGWGHHHHKCESPIDDNELKLDGTDELSLPGGTYYLEKLTINGKSELNIAGDVVIYLDGPATFNGASSINPTDGSLTLISAAKNAIKLNGSGDSSLRIVAPRADVRFSGTHEFRGAVLARTVRVNGTADLELTHAVAYLGDCESNDATDAGQAPNDNAGRRPWEQEDTGEPKPY
jgi:hypothetical protein